MWLRRLVRECRLRDVQCLIDLDLSTTYRAIGMISNEIQRELRLVYYTRADTKAAGFLETDHFGRRFRGALSHIDLTGVAQRWLRDQLWDHMAATWRDRTARAAGDHSTPCAVPASNWAPSSSREHHPETPAAPSYAGPPAA